MHQHTGPDEGETIWLGGTGVRHLLRGEDAGGRFSLVEHPLQPRELAAPLHRHRDEDEYSYVTRGRVGFVLGDDVVLAGPGSFVRKPRGQWHTFFNAGDEPAALLELISPGGFEHYFDELAPLFPADAPPDLDAMVAAGDRYGLELRFESMPELIERFELAAPPELG